MDKFSLGNLHSLLQTISWTFTFDFIIFAHGYISLNFFISLEFLSLAYSVLLWLSPFLKTLTCSTSSNLKKCRPHNFICLLRAP